MTHSPPTAVGIYVDGTWRDAISGATREVLDPSDASPIGSVAEGGRADAQAAISAARRAFDDGSWHSVSSKERAELVGQIGAAVRRHGEELAVLETREAGKTLVESQADIDAVASVFEYYAGMDAELAPEDVAPPDLHAKSELRREPIGVCGQITPWNYPLLQASWKLAPALLAGCTMVLKPSELTPLGTLRLTALIDELGLPPGVLNTVPGAGPTVGAEMAQSNDVDLVSFTGGVATGQSVMTAAATTIKKVALELGGKNPHVVFADADLDVAVDRILEGAFLHAGQVCSAGARILLQEEIADEVTDRLEARARAIRVGPGLDPRTRMGPLISREHRAGVIERVEAGKREGARLICGGALPADPALQSGFYYLPTLFADCRSDMRVVQEEIFGPVATIERFATEEEAVARANDTQYGLSAGFWTADPERIRRLSRKLRFGTIWVNDYNVYFPAAPWGGFKRSGIGRELGRAGLEEYVELKHVYRNTAPDGRGWF
ncbi:MAG: betaine-aldehyde dehydrogenase [Myxococcota bacterium]|jgi:betaine-aldehyde dehydrogenase